MVAESRAALERHWLHLIRDALPALATSRRWPVRYDHCFARILLDQVCGGRWYDHVPARPAYRHLPKDKLREAIALAEAVAAGTTDLHALNRASLAWRAETGIREDLTTPLRPARDDLGSTPTTR